MPAIAVLAAAFAPVALPRPALAQDTPDESAAPQPETDDAPETATKKTGFLDRFFDDDDGKLDFSETLAKGGFIPMPVIITEPAVDGGFGLIAQFMTVPQGKLRNVTRRMAGAVKTGNGSYGYGYFQSGPALDGRIRYKFGVARGKVTLDAFPRFAPSGLEYTNNYDYGALGTVLWRLPDERFSVGPIFDFRKLRSKIYIPGLPDDFARDFNHSLTTGALGLGLHFDSRDNPMTPTKGVNAYVEGKFNSSAFGSDRNFEIYDVDVYAFHKISPQWRLGYKFELDAARGNFPSFFAPSIDLRGVQAMRYQGSTAFSSEVEVTRQLSERWSILAFAGYGSTNAGSSRVFDDSGAIWTGGGGIRYRLARKLGLDAGVDVAVGPDGTVFYLQFGHAWSFGMD